MISQATIRRLNPVICVTVLLLLNPLVLMADPVSAFLATWYGALALSAAVSAASMGINYLLRPKPKPQDKGKLQGDIQLSNVGEDIPINEVYGGRQSDGLGGIRTGLTCVWASPIRKVVVPVPGGGGGGKGGPRAPAGTENHYYQDYAFLAGFGPLRVLDIKANTDLLYSNFIIDGLPDGDKYEAESATLGALAFPISDGELSGGVGVTTNNSVSGFCTISNIIRFADQASYRKFYITYKSRSGGDDTFDFSINGDSYNITLPASNGDPATVMTTIDLNVGSNILSFRIRGGTDAPIIDCFHVGTPIQIVIDPGCFITGMKDPNYSSPSATFDNHTLEVVGSLPDPCLQFNYQPLADATGMIEAELANNLQIRIYEGSDDQLPDPLLQAYFESRYGVGSTPAYRHRCLIVLENYETTKFGGSMPNFTALLEHRTVKDLAKMYEIRAAKAGLQSSEYNFNALNDVPLRGFVVTNIQAPKAEMEVLNRIFDAEVVQDSNGVVKGVLPDYTVERTIELEELDVVENWTPQENGTPPIAIERTVRPDEELPSYLGVSFFDATRAGETAERHAQRQSRASSGRANIETNLVMLPVEAERFAVRDLQKQWAEKDPLKIRTFWKHCRVEPATVIKCGELDGSYTKMLVKGVQGLIPSAYEITGVSHELDELAPRPFEYVTANRDADVKEDPSLFQPPAVVIGTVIDVMRFRTTELGDGVYVAAALHDTHYKWTGATLAWQRETGWERLTQLNDQCTMGQTTGALGAVPGGWDPGEWDNTNTLQIRLFYGELESLTDVEVLDRNNVMVVGDEVIAFGTATLNDAATNTWTISHLQRHLQGPAVTHTEANERAVLMNSAVKFVPLDASEVDKTRSYGFLTGGQGPEDSLTTEHTFVNAGAEASAASGVSALASESLAAGDFISFHLDSSVLKMRKADASDDTKLADGYVTAAVASGATATAYTEDGSVVTGLTGLTIGAEYFLSEAAGALTSTAPTTSGSIVQRVGKALSATTLLFRPQLIGEVE